jgi:hypothetical protein
MRWLTRITPPIPRRLSCSAPFRPIPHWAVDVRTPPLPHRERFRQRSTTLDARTESSPLIAHLVRSMESSPCEERLGSSRGWPRVVLRGVLWATTALVVGLVVAVGAQAALLKPGAVAGASQKLVPGLQRLATPAVRSASPAVQANRLNLPASGPGSLVRLGSRIVVTARMSSTAPTAIQALRGAGAQILTISARYGMVTVAVAPADLEQMAALSAVRSVTPTLRPLTAAEGPTGGSANATPSALTCPWGSVRSEGDTQLDADQARGAFGIDGSGAKVGIISDSFDTDASAVTHASDDVTNGDLPGSGNPCGQTTPVQNVLDSPGGSDEGRAMAQVVHDLAPGAPLAFAPRPRRAPPSPTWSPPSGMPGQG